MKKFIKKIFGIEKIEADKLAADQARSESLAKAAEAKLQEEQAKAAEELKNWLR